MPRFVLAGPAQRDLREIRAWLSQHNPTAAARIRMEFREAMTKLAQLPYMGHVRPDLTKKPLRFLTVYPYYIIYKPETKPLEIVRILHGKRDVKRLLRKP